jgi:hypothetical protein
MQLFSACGKGLWMSESHYMARCMFKRSISSVGVEKYIQVLKDYSFEVLTGIIDLSEHASF